MSAMKTNKVGWGGKSHRGFFLANGEQGVFSEGKALTQILAQGSHATQHLGTLLIL